MPHRAGGTDEDRDSGVLAVMLTLAALALLDEVTQPLVGRTASRWDFLADGMGVVLASLVFLARKRD
jgi:VanZ family protein